jgi:hypothetical protein
MEWIDAHPDLEVQPAEYRRLLGYPPGFEPDGRSVELAAWAREWYAAHGHPWIYAREVGSLEFDGRSLAIEGACFHGEPLRRRLERAAASGAVVAAVSAGPEIEQHAQQLWSEEKPDEYYFLEVLGSAVVERLTTLTGGILCAWAENQGMAVLPHYSPGYPEWDIAEQSRLLGLLKDLPGNLEALDSGALRPKKSLLAVFGMTQQRERVRRLTDLVACETCTLEKCQFRRAPLQPPVSYAVNAKALRKWAQERLELRHCDDGTIDALFRYEGTTCTNMGRPIAFQYRVKLGPREAGYPIREQECAPDPSDSGHRYMCRYSEDREALMAAIAREKPLLGRPLDEVLTWVRPAGGAGCYCDAADREHKWGLALETIHYALRQRDTGRP